MRHRQGKYRAIETTVDGITFASRKEAERYTILKNLQKSGKITDLKLQPRFEIIPKQPGERAAYYTADFMYRQGGAVVVEEVKSEVTAKKPDYVLRRKLFKMIHRDYIFSEYI